MHQRECESLKLKKQINVILCRIVDQQREREDINNKMTEN